MADSKSQANKLKDQGNAALAEGNVDVAINCYNDAIKMDPENHVLFSNRSAANAKANRYLDALKDAEKTILLKPTWPKGYSRKGAALAYLGRHQQALDAYQDGLKHDPNNQQLLDAVKDVKQSMMSQQQSFPNPFSGPEVMTKLAMDPRTREYLKDPEYINIISELQRNPQALSTFLKDTRVLTTLSILMGLNIDQTDEDMDVTPSEDSSSQEKTPPSDRQTNNDENSASLPKELQEEKKLALQEKELGNESYKKRDFETALHHYRKAVELDPCEMTFLNNIAAVYFETKEYDECIKKCEKALEVGREQRADFKIIAKSYLRMGNAYFKQKNYLKAKEMYEKSLTEHRTPDTRLRLAEVEKLWKEQELKAYVDPDKALEEKNLGNDAFQKGDYPKALKHYSEAIRRNPEDAKLYSNRAACYTKLAEFQLGLKDCDECIRLDPTFIKGFIRKGTILLALKETSKAAHAYRQAMELDSNNQEALDGFRRCSMAQNSDPEDVRKRAMGDPDVQKILTDPAMRLILDQMQEDPKALQEHLRNPEIAAKIQKLIESGLIAIR